MTRANSSPIATAIADGWQTMAEQEQDQELLPAISPSTPPSSTSTRDADTMDGLRSIDIPLSDEAKGFIKTAQILAEPWREDIARLTVERDSLRGVVQAVEAERDELRAALASLCSCPASSLFNGPSAHCPIHGSGLAAAADAPQPGDGQR